MLKNENVYSKIFLKLMKNQYFQFFLRHWFLNLWRLINIWIWYLELAFIPLWLIRKKESDQIKIRKIILKLWVFELIWGKTFCSSFNWTSCLTVLGQKIKKSPGQKNSWNQINQFHEFFFHQIPFFAISKMVKNQFLNWE